MNRTVAFLILISIITFHSQCSVARSPIAKSTIDLKKDFGAIGNGISNDSKAFEKAANYINQRGGNVTLNIPQGTYIIGHQKDFANGLFKDGNGTIILSNCSNVVINGNNAILKYKNGLYFGSFNPNSRQPHHAAEALFLKGNYLADVGNSIELNNCKNVTIKDLDIDGNMQNAIVGGKYGDVGIQAQYTGVAIYNSSKIYLNNSRFHHLGLDGITIKNKNQANRAVNDDIVIDNCQCNYNGRQGLSITGCVGINIKNSEFSHTGRGKIASNPTAGIDIEAEDEINRNVTIDNCKIINNVGVGIVADRGNSRNVMVKNSTIWGTTQWSIWLNIPQVTISNCKIYGSTVNSYSTTNKSDATRYLQCEFRDTTNSYGPYLINNDGVQYILYDGCSFYPKVKRACYVKGASAQKEDYPMFANCKFYLDITHRTVENDYWFIWFNMQYKDCSFYYNVSQKDLQRRYISSGNIIPNGNNQHIYNKKF